MRGQDAYETCMEKLAEYRIPGTMYINTKKFHEFLKSTEKQPAVRSWQLSKQSPQVSEASTSLPTHTNDYSMLRVHRTGLTRPRSRSNGSSFTPAHTGQVPMDSPEDNVEVVEKYNLNMGDTTVRRNNAITNAFLDKKFNTNNVQPDKRVLNEVHHSSDKATNHNLGNSHNETHSDYNDCSQEMTASKTTVDQILTKEPNIVNKSAADLSTHTRQDVMPATVSMEDFKDTFVLVEGKKKKKTKVHNKIKISSQPSVSHSKEINNESIKRNEELNNQVISTEKTVQIEPLNAKEIPAPTVLTFKPVEDSDIREQQENIETEKPFEESNTSPADSPKPPSPHSSHSYGSNWYSPFSSGLQLDILPRQEPSYHPKVPSYNIHSESIYGNNSGVVMNQRRHYQQSSLPRNPSPKNLVGRERLHEQPFQPSGFRSLSPAYNYQPYNMSHRLEQGHWRGSSHLASDDSADKNYDLEFSLFDREWP